jgi:heat shock protein HtpX
MAIPAAFKGRRLKRRAWTIPFTLAFAPLVLYVLFLWLPMLASNPIAALSYVPAFALDVVLHLGPVPFGVCAFIAVMALISGLTFSSSAKELLAGGLGVEELPNDAPLTRRVHKFAKELGLPPPKVGVMREANAYAIGSSAKDAAVVIGYPLLQSLQPDELDAIIGHELGHILTGDMKRMQMAAGFQSLLDHTTTVGTQAGAQSVRTRESALLVVMIGALLRWTVYLVSELMMKAQSRRREFAADAVGALVSSPTAMANALRRLHAIPIQKSELSARYACLMFFGVGGHLWATHPTVDRRLAALESGKPLAKLVQRGTRGRFGFLSPVVSPLVTHVRSHPRVAAWLADATLAPKIGATVLLLGGLYLMF